MHLTESGIVRGGWTCNWPLCVNCGPWFGKILDLPLLWPWPLFFFVRLELIKVSHIKVWLEELLHTAADKCCCLAISRIPPPLCPSPCGRDISRRPEVQHETRHHYRAGKKTFHQCPSRRSEAVSLWCAAAEHTSSVTLSLSLWPLPFRFFFFSLYTSSDRQSEADKHTEL